MSRRLPLYESFASEYEAHAESSPYNAMYDRPALLELLGEARDLAILDAGAGPGLYAEELTRRGARVSGFDQSPAMVELAKKRLGDAAQFRTHDLEEPLGWLEDSSFDAVVCALVLHYVDNRVAALRELHRVLRPTGQLVLSTHHPTLDWQLHGGSYFTEEVIEETWSKGWRMRYWRLPLGRVCEEFSQAGFVIDALVEPQPALEMQASDPARHEKLSTQPAFIAFRLTKR